MKRSMLRHLVLALAPALLVTAAHAQPAGQPPGPQGPHGAPSAEMKARHEAMQKQQMEDLRTVLRLRPDQEAALTAFVAAHHRAERRDLPRPDDKPETTPERLDRMAKREGDMAARHAQTREALSKFYAALSPDQQKVFDALQRLKGPRGGPGGRGGSGGRVIMHRGPGGHGEASARHDMPH